MSKNFSDFNDWEPKNSTEKTQSSEDEVKKAYENLKNLDQDSLQSKLAEEIAKQKANGSFNFDLLSKSVESMKAFMPADTYENLKRLLENIK